MYSVILTELGIAVMEEEKCLEAFPFSNPSEDYVFVKKGESRLSDLSKFLSKVENVIEVNDHSLLTILKKKSIDAHLMNEEHMTNIQSTKPKILTIAGFAKDEKDAMEKLRDFAIQLSSSKVSEVSESPDLHIIQAINTLDETDKIINGISSRLREWYGLHFPELDNIVDSIHGYSQIVLEGKREDLSKNVYENAGFPDSKVEMLSLVQEKSRGGKISDENLAIVQTLAKQILELHELRKNLEEHVEKEMNKVVPNLTVILGPTVGARILARAGSIKNLSSMPASTIQVLGAEKALFRSLKTGSRKSSF
jgi:nucleolar protein 56